MVTFLSGTHARPPNSKRLAGSLGCGYRYVYRLWRKTSRENKNRMSFSDLNEFAMRLRQVIDASARIDSVEAFDEGVQLFQSLALELFHLQFRYNDTYQRFCKSRGISPRNIEHWGQMPAIPTAGFKELALSSLPVDTRTRVFHSSGTTGHRPSHHFHCAESLSVYEASLWPWFASHLLPELKLIKENYPAN